MEYREELFPEIPVVFEGVNDEEYAMKAAENPLVTGIIEKLSVEKNIDMALKVNPTADKVVAILDDSVTADAERKNFTTQRKTIRNWNFLRSMLRNWKQPDCSRLSARWMIRRY